MMAQLRRTALATCLLAFLFIQCGGSSNPPEAPSNPATDTSAPPPAEPPNATDGGTSSMPATPATIASESATNQQTAPPSTAAADQTKAKLSDQQIAKVTDSANSAEIAQANVAIEKSKN